MEMQKVSKLKYKLSFKKIKVLYLHYQRLRLMEFIDFGCLRNIFQVLHSLSFSYFQFLQDLGMC
jgi:hypothetical protein